MLNDSRNLETDGIWKMMYMKTICIANLIYLGITYLIWPMTVQYGTSPKQYLKFVSYNWLIISLSLSLSLSISLSRYISHPLLFSLYSSSVYLALLISRCIFFRIRDDDLCHYFLIHECTRGRIRVSYVSWRVFIAFHMNENSPMSLKYTRVNVLKLAFKI